MNISQFPKIPILICPFCKKRDLKFYNIYYGRLSVTCSCGRSIINYTLNIFPNPGEYIIFTERYSVWCRNTYGINYCTISIRNIQDKIEGEYRELSQESIDYYHNFVSLVIDNEHLI